MPVRTRNCSVWWPFAWTPPDPLRVLPRHVDKQRGLGEVRPKSAKPCLNHGLSTQYRPWNPGLALRTEKRLDLACSCNIRASHLKCTEFGGQLIKGHYGCSHTPLVRHSPKSSEVSLDYKTVRYIQTDPLWPGSDLDSPVARSIHFQLTEENFRYGMILTVSFSTHAGQDALAVQLNSRAKYAAAFFRISRSIVTSGNSFLSRSKRSLVLWPCRGR